MCQKKTIRLLVFVFLFWPCFSIAQTKDRLAFDRGTFIEKGDTLPYRILFPLDFNPAKKYPLVIVLHGAGERGNNNESQLLYGPELFLKDTIRENYPAIVVYPQCPANSYWSDVKIETDSATDKSKFIFQADAPPTKAMKLLIGLIHQLVDKPFTQKHKVYIGGLSMGGMGTLEIIGREPKVFAAAFAICGGDNTINVAKYAKKVPVWIFHGEKDNVVPYTHSEAVVAAIKEDGGNPKYTLYPNDDPQ